MLFLENINRANISSEYLLKKASIQVPHLVIINLLIMRKKIFTLFIILSSTFIACAQSLSGHVIDSSTHIPMASASIYIPQLKLGAVTNQKGYYKIGSLPKGNYDVQVQAIGYSTIIRQVNISN